MRKLISYIYFLVLALAVGSTFLYAQEENSFSPLYETTLVRDIETSNYYELVAWLRTLGLSEDGSANLMRNRLMEHYNLSGSEGLSAESSGSIITIESAMDTSYFTIEENDEQMIILKGGVKVRMDDSTSSNRSHAIEADEIVFNQSTSSITASGNLVYTMTQNGTDETFSGDSMTFSVKSWTGVVFKGSSQFSDTVDGNEQTFYFEGDKLYKSGQSGLYIIEDGTIKTQNWDDPDFQLKSKKLWMMGPGEWGVLQGTLYIGHIPILYIPFYYKPGNEMFFNPVVGSRSDDGIFLQTTTYLLGRKVPDVDSSSFFSLGALNPDEYTLVREGLYLMKSSAASDKADESKHTLKVMADFYSRLGAYSGIEGEFYDIGFIDSLNFFAGIGVSRSLESNGDFIFKVDDEFTSLWHSTEFAGLSIPFRWGSEFDSSWNDLDIEIEFYSDPYFNRDFLERSEDFDWLNAVITSEESDDSEPDTLTDMTWKLNYSHNFDTDLLSPFVETLSMNPFRMEIEWDVNTKSTIDDSYDPTNQFFYPSSVSLPYTQITIGGTPLSYSTDDGWDYPWLNSNDEEDEIGEAGDAKLRLPWESADSEGADEDEILGTKVVGVESQRSSISFDEKTIFETQFDYSLTSLFELSGEADEDDYSDPGEFKIAMTNSNYIFNNRLSTSFDNYFFDKSIVVSSQDSISSTYKEHVPVLGSDEDDIGYDERLEDYSYQSLSWENQFAIDVYPLRDFDDFSSSQLTYNLNNDVYDRSFDSYVDGEDPVFETLWASWDEDTVTRHDTGFILKYNPAFYSLSSTVTFDLPPLERSDYYVNRAELDIFNWESSLSQTTTYDEDGWTPNSLIFDTSYEPFDNVEFGQRFEYSLEEHVLQKSVSTLDLFGFYCEFTGEYTTPYSWDSTNLNWVSSDDQFVPSELDLGYKLDIVKEPYWKNRMYFTSNVSLDWDMDLQQVNDNVLSFSWYCKYHIFQFMDIELNMRSANNNMYLYLPNTRKEMGITTEYNFFEDLAKSFNIFSPNQEDRYESFFNMESLSLDLVHHLRDWDLTFSYSGSPSLDDDAYIWDSEFSIYIIWNPIPQIQSEITREDKEWTVDTR